LVYGATNAKTLDTDDATGGSRILDNGNRLLSAGSARPKNVFACDEYAFESAMNPVAVIEKKRDGGRLADAEIRQFVDGFVRGAIPDYQAAALAMAIFFRGMDRQETVALTQAIWHSGQSLHWDRSAGPVVDKHSTGGIGDKVSLVLAPLLASCGMRVPLLSGRGLGFTGGTLDKLESIPGLRTELSIDEIQTLTNRVGVVIAGQTADLAPADKRLYALRDVTGAVPSMPLIVASILGKKLAAKADALVLDVKWGSGAFMKRLDEACALAEELVAAAAALGLSTTAFVTDMNQPVGRMVGNALEVQEAIETLHGAGPHDLVELVLTLGSELLVQVGAVAASSEGAALLRQKLESGQALAKFQEMVEAQGGRWLDRFAVAPSCDIVSTSAGYISAIDGAAIGIAVAEAGGGRKRLGEQIDHSVGVELAVRIGERVEVGQRLMRVFAPPDRRGAACQQMERAIRIGERPELGSLIVKRFACSEPLGPRQ
jgi:pyrimidine-nucleoside phosphorylase